MLRLEKLWVQVGKKPEEQKQKNLELGYKLFLWETVLPESLTNYNFGSIFLPLAFFPPGFGKKPLATKTSLTHKPRNSADCRL
jgi:hypothetical protein